MMRRPNLSADPEAVPAMHWRDVALYVALFTIAFTGRLVNLIVVGDYEGWWQPMTVEALHVIVIALAIKSFPPKGASPANPA